MALTVLPEEIKEKIAEIFKGIKHDDDGSKFAQLVVNEVVNYRSRINQTLCYKRLYKR